VAKRRGHEFDVGIQTRAASARGLFVLVRSRCLKQSSFANEQMFSPRGCYDIL